MVYTPAELEALAAVIKKSDIYVISDEIYEKILYDGAEHVSIALAGQGCFRAYDHDQRRQQVFCDDRLENRLRCRAVGCDQGHGQVAEPGDIQSYQ